MEGRCTILPGFYPHRESAPRFHLFFDLQQYPVATEILSDGSSHVAATMQTVTRRTIHYYARKIAFFRVILHSYLPLG